MDEVETRREQAEARTLCLPTRAAVRVSERVSIKTFLREGGLYIFFKVRDRIVQGLYICLVCQKVRT